MNRKFMEILFRGKRIDNGKWVEGNLIISKNVDKDFTAIIIPIDNGMYTENGDKDLGFESWYKVDKNTVCPYIGRNDENGNKIFKGDIVYTINDGIRNPNYVIIWDSDELDFKATNGKENYYTNYEYISASDYIEVIGNIFDNPELMNM